MANTYRQNLVLQRTLMLSNTFFSFQPWPMRGYSYFPDPSFPFPSPPTHLHKIIRKHLKTKLSSSAHVRWPNSAISFKLRFQASFQALFQPSVPSFVSSFVSNFSSKLCFFKLCSKLQFQTSFASTRRCGHE